MPQGTILDPILFSILINDIKPACPIKELCKFADNTTVEAPGYNKDDTGTEQVENSISWSDKIRMVLNMDKTYETIVRGKT